MNRLIIILLIFTACSQEEEYRSRGSEIEPKSERDTILNGEVLRMSYSKEIDENGDLFREGFIVKESAIGIHKFYKNNKLHAEREYVHWTNEKLKLLTNIDSLIAKDVSSSMTYLNQAKFLDEEKKVIEENSTFYEITIDNEEVQYEDSIKAIISFFEPQIEIKWIEVYFDLPEDSSRVRVIQSEGNTIEYAHKVEYLGRQTKISGIAILNGFLASELPRDTLFASRVMYFEKPYKIKNESQQGI